MKETGRHAGAYCGSDPGTAADAIKAQVDEADAYHIARFAARFLLLLDGKIDKDVLLPSEQHVFLKERSFVRGKHAGETHQLGTLFREGERFFRFSQL